MEPTTRVEIGDEKGARHVLDFVERLEDLDDVQIGLCQLRHPRRVDGAARGLGRRGDDRARHRSRDGGLRIRDRRPPTGRACGSWMPERSAPTRASTDAARLAELEAALDQLVAEHHPDRVAVERLYFQRNVQTAMAVGQARGVALLVAARPGLHAVTEPTPNEVKLAVCGNGAADKAAGRGDGRLACSGVPPQRRCGRRHRCPGGGDRGSSPPARCTAGTRHDRLAPRSGQPRRARSRADRHRAGLATGSSSSPALLGKPAPGLRGATSSSTTWSARTSRPCSGSRKPEELAFFELLMTVTGVGPRLALAITSAHPVTRLQMAIVTDDLDVLTSVSRGRPQDRPADRPRAPGEDPRRRDRGRTGRRRRLGRRGRPRVAGLHRLRGAPRGGHAWQRSRVDSTSGSGPLSRGWPAPDDAQPSRKRSSGSSGRPRGWRRWACSSNPDRPSHGVARTLMRSGYRVIPVNPRETEVHGLRAYADLFAAQDDAVAAGHPIEVVNIFRNAALAGIHADEAIEIGAKAVWMLRGVDRRGGGRAGTGGRPVGRHGPLPCGQASRGSVSAHDRGG